MKRLLEIILVGLLTNGLLITVWGEVRVEEKQTIEDPYGEKFILGMILRYPAFINLLGAEIGLNESQKKQLEVIVKTEEDTLRKYRYLQYFSGEEQKRRSDEILKSTDEDIKKLLSPIQYAQFRDWVIEEWILEVNLDKQQYNIPITDVAPVIIHWIDFIQTKLKLSQKEIETIKQLICQAKQKIIPLRRKFAEIARDQSITLEKTEEIGLQFAKQIASISLKLQDDIIKTLPLDKGKLYHSYMKIPVKNGNIYKRE